eukprot:TRINITY_DN1924_c0_g1_i6.p1 TRINITY_DN1924_c0_g1~~TRINITY_DN1924_c0_g1_i6.p1  ORF type:complete len:362 (-),score=155.69 TRINITY_DN1924_c0_g1_i6:1-1086(-)
MVQGMGEAKAQVFIQKLEDAEVGKSRELLIKHTANAADAQQRLAEANAEADAKIAEQQAESERLSLEAEGLKKQLEDQMAASAAGSQEVAQAQAVFGQQLEAKEAEVAELRSQLEAAATQSEQAQTSLQQLHEAKAEADEKREYLTAETERLSSEAEGLKKQLEEQMAASAVGNEQAQAALSEVLEAKNGELAELKEFSDKQRKHRLTLMFNRLDRDETGGISKEEMTETFTGDISKFFSALDTNADGKVSIEEWLGLFNKMGQGMGEAKDQVFIQKLEDAEVGKSRELLIKHTANAADAQQRLAEANAEADAKIAEQQAESERLILEAEGLKKQLHCSSFMKPRPRLMPRSLSSRLRASG